MGIRTSSLFSLGNLHARLELPLWQAVSFDETLEYWTHLAYEYVLN